MGKEFSTLPLIVPRVLVIGQWDLTSFYIYQVLYKDLVVPPYFLCRFPTNSLGHILPALWGVLVIQSQSPLELLVLLWCPRVRTTGRIERA